MAENLLAGLLILAITLPCMGLGLAIAMGKVRTARVAAACDPERARVAVGGFLLLLNALIAVLGVLLLVTPLEKADQLAPWGVAVVLTVTALGLVPLLRAVRA